MPHRLTWIDRLRIERVVWMLDQRLYDLPRRARIAKRRELRDDLRVAAADVGARDAIRNLGDHRQLAADYLAAELGDGPRASWVAAGVYAATVPLLLNWFLTAAIDAFADGVKAADPAASGRFAFGGIAFLQDEVTVTIHGGDTTFQGGAYTPLLWVLLVGSAILVGKLWRAVPVGPNRRRPATTATA